MTTRRVPTASSVAWLACALLAACSRTPLFSPAATHPCLPLDPRGQSSKIVSADVELVQSDILFLVDISASMADEIGRIREQVRDVIAPQIRARLPDSDLGLAVFSDFGEVALGQRSHPYLLLQQMTDDEAKVRAATEKIKLEYGGDDAESQLEALYQAATGKGYGSYIEAKKNCPRGTRGGACFRDGSFAIAMLFTDAPMRNVTGIQPDGSLSPEDVFNPFAADAPYIPYVRTYDETIAALHEQSIRVLGLWSGGDDGLDDMRRVVRDSGGIDEAGEPIVFDIGSDGKLLGDGVVRSLESLIAGVQIDVRLLLTDGDTEDDLDPRTLVTAVHALRAEPAQNAVLDGERFTHVRTGTHVFFQVDFDTSSLPLSATDRRYPIELRVQGEDGTLLSEQVLDVVVEAQASCPAPQG